MHLGRAVFHNVNLAGAVLFDVNLREAVIGSAAIDGLKILGVEVEPLIEAELKRRAEAAQA